MLAIFKWICLSLALVLFTSFLAAAAAAEWDNPADRYKDAYKAYGDASCPIASDDIAHFVYFTRDRKRMRKHPFLKSDRFEGAQIMYSWRQLEKSKGKYDFSDIRSDIKYLKSHGKRLFIQLQDVSFSAKYKPVPNYLLKPTYDGGVVPSLANAIAGEWQDNWMDIETVEPRCSRTLSGFVDGVRRRI